MKKLPSYGLPHFLFGDEVGVEPTMNAGRCENRQWHFTHFGYLVIFFKTLSCITAEQGARIH